MPILLCPRIRAAVSSSNGLCFPPVLLWKDVYFVDEEDVQVVRVTE